MDHFASYVSGFRVPQGQLGVFWLGQAGFLFKTGDGRLIAVDPYLSDCCNRYFGFRRQIAKLLQPYDLEFDLLLASHAHYDHFDPDAVPMLMDNGRTQLIAARDVEAECERLHLRENITYVKPGDSVNRCGVTIRAVPCDHGGDAPDAVGFYLDFGGKTVYLVGDSCFAPKQWEDPSLHDADLLILPVNGAYGNLDSVQAVEVVRMLRPRLAIPCHYGNFAAHGGDPQRFIDLAEEWKLPFRIMRQGEAIRI